MLLRSSMLELDGAVRHAFSTREGGVSTGPYASLNLGRAVGDAPEAVEENRRRFLSAAELGPPERLAEASQVHGTAVVRATAASVGALRAQEADALWTDEPGLAVGVRTADCVPVLLVALDARGHPSAVAAVHAGWRGATAGIVGATLRALRDALGVDPGRVRAALGPAISGEAFEVGLEVIEAARASLDGRPPPARSGPNGRPHLDLPALVRQHLEDAGVPPSGIEVLPACTHGDAALFFSHRRDGGRTGRHLSAIQIAR